MRRGLKVLTALAAAFLMLSLALVFLGRGARSPRAGIGAEPADAGRPEEGSNGSVADPQPRPSPETPAQAAERARPGPRAAVSNPLDRMSPGIVSAPPGGPAPYVLRDRNVSVFFGPKGLAFSLFGAPHPAAARGERRGWGLHWGIAGAREVEPRPEGELPGKVNSFRGDPSQWKTDQASYSQVVYEEVRPGLDVVVEARPKGVKYSLHAARAADVGSLRLNYEGALQVRVLDDGAALAIETDVGTLREDGLKVTQEGRPVPARYVAHGGSTYGIAVENADPALPLEVDPVIGWSAFVGGSQSPGSGYDNGYAIAVDGSGNAYVTGTTSAVDFPTTGGFDTVISGSYDVFVTKVNAAGNTLAWSSFLGGSSDEYGQGIAVDGTGNVYVTGYTWSSNFPTTLGAYDTTYSNGDVFVAKIAAAGSSVTWSTLLGGSSSEYAWTIRVDSSNNVYVAGYTYSTDFPVSGGFDTAVGSTPDGFVTKLNDLGTGLVWSSYLGGNSTDVIYAMTLDSGNNVYLTGYTYSSDFPTTGGFDTTYNGSADVFVTKVNAAGSTLAWSSYLGGTGYENGYGIAVDAAANVYVTGYTSPSGVTPFPTTVGAYDTLANSSDAFVTKVAAAGSSISWSTFLGGFSSEYSYGIAVNSSNEPYVVGYTYSSDFPTTLGAYDTAIATTPDGFVTRFNSFGSGLVYSTFVGGNSSDLPRGMALDASGNVYFTGYTYSSDYPTTGGFDTTYGSGAADAMVTKVNASGSGLVWSSYLGGANGPGNDEGWQLAVDSTGNAYISGLTYSIDFPTTVGAFDPTYAAGSDVFVTKVAPAGTLVWSTYLGGTNWEYPYAMTIDGGGNVYVAGYTGSIDFPITPGAYDTVLTGFSDSFVTKLNASGASLAWSTFLGGTSDEYIFGIAVDSGGAAYVTGYTYSSDFPTTPGAYDTTFESSPDSFVTKINASGSGLDWSTFLGGNSGDYAQTVGVNGSGEAFVAGNTDSTNFPTTPGSFQPVRPGGFSSDVFVTRFNSTGSALVWSTYVAGTDYETVSDIAVDPSTSDVIIGGYTYSTDFPVTGGDTTYNGSGDCFITQIDASGATLDLSTYLGGTNYETLSDLDIDPFGNVYVTGYTFSFDFPMKGAFDSTYNGGYDVFVTKLNGTSVTVSWSSYLGGTLDDYGYGIGRDSTGTVYVAGWTYSSDFPAFGAFDSTLNGNYDGFLTKLDNSDPTVPTLLAQFKQDGTTALGVGAWTNEANIVVKATCGDSDDDPVQLEVEIKPIAVAFDGSGTTTSALFPAGTRISLSVPLPLVGSQFHWRCRSIDANGRTSLWNAFGGNADLPLPAARDVGKDTTGPGVTISSPTAASSYSTASSPISLSGSSSDDLSGVTTVTWVNDRGGSGTATGTTSWSIGSVALSAGVNVITVTGTDAAGNTGSDALVVTYDTTPPSVTIESPTTNPTHLTGSATLALGGSANDGFQVASITWVNDRGGSGTATLGGTQPSAVTWSTSVSLAPGANIITVTATDGAGNTGVDSITVTYDNVPPTVTIVTPTPPSFTTAATFITISGTASDANGIKPSGVTWSTNGAVTPSSGTATGTTSWSATIDLAPGTNLITITALDSVDNSASAAITIYRDNADPVVTITIPTSNPTYTTGTGTITIGGTATDDISVTEVTWVNSAGGSGTATLSGPPNSRTWSAAGIALSSVLLNTITVTVKDSVNRTSTDVIDITYDTTSPSLIVTSPPSASHVTSTTPITVTGTASDLAPGTVNSVTVQNLTTGVFSTVTASPTLPAGSTSWSAPVSLVIGTNTVEIKATDNASLTTTVTITIILDPYVPAITITGPTGGSSYVAGTGTIALSGVASDNRGVTEVRWDNTTTGGFGFATLSGPATSPSWTVASIPLNPGPNDIVVTAKDEALLTATDTLAVTQDTTVPGITITTPTSAPTFTTTATTSDVAGTASDNVSLASVTWTNSATGGSGTATGTTSWSVTAMPLAAGTNVITVVATDSAGYTTSDTITLYRDTALPTVTITSPTGAATYNTTAATITLGGTASDDIAVSSVSWSSDRAVIPASGTASGTNAWSVASISLLPGANVLTVTATDGAGQTSASVTLTVTYDPTAPGIAITTPSSDPFSTTATPVDLVGTASDNLGVTEVTWLNSSTGGVGTATGTTAWSASVPLTSGTNSITVTAVDAAGNTTSASITVVYDPAAPIVQITSPTTGLSFTTGVAPITISGTASDDVGVASVSWSTNQPVTPASGTATGTTSWSASIPLAPGPNEITITATDGVGRTGTARITIVYDATPPVVQITDPTTESSFKITTATANLGGSAADNLNIQSVTWNNAANGASGTAIGTGVWTITGVALVQGSNIITVSATDGVGNVGTATLDVIYDGTNPTVAIASPVPTGSPPAYSTNVRPVALSGTATDNLEVAGVSWTNSLGGSGAASLSSGSITNRTWTASVQLFPGNNDITVTAVDGHGYTATATLTVIYTPETDAPTIAINVPTNSGTWTTTTMPLTIGGDADDTFGVTGITWRNLTTRVRGTASMGTPPPAVVTTWTADIPLTNGINVIVVTAVDDAGNTATDTINVTYDAPADSADPAVNIILPTTLDAYSSSVSPLDFTFDATDGAGESGVATVRWYNSATGGDGFASPATGTTWTASIALAQGFNVITVTATDAQGNFGTDMITVSFSPPPGDAIPPAVSITSHPIGTTLTWTASPITLGGDASDNVGVATVVYANGATTTTGSADGLGPWSVDITLQVGINVITVRAYDTSGNFTTTSITIDYAPPPPPPQVLPSGHCGSVGFDLLWPLGLLWLARRAGRAGRERKKR